jgi:hypothetical protein
MNAPQRIRLSRAKGWRKPEGTVVVARPSIWGNPFVVGRDGTRADCVELYAALAGGLVCLTTKATVAEIERAQEAIGIVEGLKGKNLACWCSLDAPCHADVLLALANEPRRAGMLNRFFRKLPEPVL